MDNTTQPTQTAQPPAQETTTETTQQNVVVMVTGVSLIGTTLGNK